MVIKRMVLPLLFALAPAALLQAQTDAVEAVRQYRNAHAAGIINEYRTFLRMPNVASDLPDIRRNAEYLAGEFGKRGVDMELLTLPDRPDAPPVVFGELRVPGAERTLVIYVHYDGQPVDPGSWAHDPWEPTLYSGSMEREGRPIPFPAEGETVDPEWRIYARSASDD
ncbi:MAG: hypothetical protein R3281_14755 [Balneolaceae bacterium]|nr:hypothetical protein [Balneolaceae bacterium]